MTTYVLVHGAWHGGWCWSRVAERLQGRGHRVTMPTMTGLGERSHLLSPEIVLETFCEDLVQHLIFEDVEDAVLVGHSFGGSPISAAAERVGARVARLVYLDALIARGGETPSENLPADVVALRRQLAEDSSGGLSVPVPPAAAMGVHDPADAAWVARLLTPHPAKTFETPLNIDGAPGAGKPAEYICCVDPVYSNLAGSVARARELSWPVREIATGHDAMITAPDAVTALLDPDG